MQLIEIFKDKATLSIHKNELMKLSTILDAVIQQYDDLDPTILKAEVDEVISANDEIEKILNAIWEYET